MVDGRSNWQQTITDLLVIQTMGRLIMSRLPGNATHSTGILVGS